MLQLWTPEDKAFWEGEGQGIANLNLWISIPALFLAFAVWQLWSVVAVNLPALGFKYTPNQLFWLAALPALSGATLRIFYSFMVPIVGGRRWTAISTASLLIPAVGIGIADDYPTNIGTISGIVGLAGGLGGFVLPIMFGALMDLTGIRSSAFMLMYGVVWVSLIWMYWTEVRKTEVIGSKAREFSLAG